ncbi:MAG: DUF4294 domain-containing protein [Cytophagaceae bacterium]|jgi:hypothetical protein|nr:DUF4294 domain-containing protein [Cytophagaceae bacterium]
MKTLLLISVFIGLGWNAYVIQGQNQPPVRRDVNVLNIEIVDGDTIPHVNLKEVTIIPQWKFKNKREEIVYTRLMRNVKIALPYARTASKKLYEINTNMTLIDGEKARKQYLSKAEKALFSEFETPIRKLTFSQGKVLIKLIDRETGNTGYELIKEYKGGVSAFFWQGIARLFGANLKDGYKPDEEDAMIEHIVKLIDSGMI